MPVPPGCKEVDAVLFNVPARMRDVDDPSYMRSCPPNILKNHLTTVRLDFVFSHFATGESSFYERCHALWLSIPENIDWAPGDRPENEDQFWALLDEKSPYNGNCGQAASLMEYGLKLLGIPAAYNHLFATEPDQPIRLKNCGHLCDGLVNGQCAGTNCCTSKRNEFYNQCGDESDPTEYLMMHFGIIGGYNDGEGTCHVPGIYPGQGNPDLYFPMFSDNEGKEDFIQPSPEEVLCELARYYSNFQRWAYWDSDFMIWNDCDQPGWNPCPPNCEDCSH